ncbi:MAG: four helix bundle protein [Bacteroidales bacterium]|nr:four helix bundle protein [Bacteroidales bacterium]
MNNASFEDLDIWKEGMRLALQIYKTVKTCKDFGFKDQVQRAAISIPSNISEGFERQTNKEFIQFLYIAKGSCGELRTQIYLGHQLEYINKKDYNAMLEKTKSLSSMLSSFIKARKKFTS